MKKLIGLLVMSMVFALAACGSNESEKAKVKKDEPKAEDVSKDEVSKDGVYFKDGVAKLEDIQLEILETKVIPVGETGNEYGDKPVFAIWYNATNFTDDDIDPSTAWIAVFEAVQDNDPNMVNKLSVGSLPDEAHLDTQLNTIKKDGTVENSIAYELDDLETPVTLIATQGIGGDKLGEQNFEVK